ncbi:hypothetical protein NQ314_019720 [Rhamnusium bicolor]|uniref:Uncharacterized protein n=1 Tax=Rhamnusium bicolor TaxID=1586634 RepID=A0AAV8WN54_9CUCU|nr:hypothetical protein NQ314_019720 [Rhamnusium bicolor]
MRDRIGVYKMKFTQTHNDRKEAGKRFCLGVYKHCSYCIMTNGVGKKKTLLRQTYHYLYRDNEIMGVS